MSWREVKLCVGNVGSFGIRSSGREVVVLHGVRCNVGKKWKYPDKEREEKESGEILITLSLFV